MPVKEDCEQHAGKGTKVTTENKRYHVNLTRIKFILTGTGKINYKTYYLTKLFPLNIVI